MTFIFLIFPTLITSLEQQTCANVQTIEGNYKVIKQATVLEPECLPGVYLEDRKGDRFCVKASSNMTYSYKIKCAQEASFNKEKDCECGLANTAQSSSNRIMYPQGK